jgi:3-hydroxyacyl-[acyl-carrier-protein] dehydratase
MRIEYFQLITRIDKLDIAAGTLEALGQVPLTSTIFEGHFPGYPIMPGVLLIESMAQACGHLILATLNYEAMPFLVAVKDAKMRSFVTPGSALTVSARLEHMGSGYAVAHGQISHEGKRMTEAEIRFMIMPFPSDAMKHVMLDLVESLGLPRPQPKDPSKEGSLA